MKTKDVQSLSRHLIWRAAFLVGPLRSAARTSHPSIEVGRARIRDNLHIASAAHTSARHGHADGTGVTTKRHGNLVDACRQALEHLRAGSDGDGRSRCLSSEDNSEHGIFKNLARSIASLISVDVDVCFAIVADSLRRTCTSWRVAVPEHDLVSVDSRCRVAGIIGVLVRRNLVWQRLQPRRMRIAVDVRLCAGGDAGIMNGSDIVGLAVVVPGHDLDEARKDGGGLHPAVVPHRVTAPDPGFVVLWEVSVEPRRDA